MFKLKLHTQNISAMTGSLVAWMLCCLSSSWTLGQNPPNAPPGLEPIAPLVRAKDLSEAFRAASKSLTPSVVTVLSKRNNVNETLDALGLLEDAEKYSSVGSGVILSEDGLIVTNAHVIMEANVVQVRLHDGREFQGTDIRKDINSDIAIFWIKCPEPLAAVSLADSDQLSVGDWVLAVGSPFNFEQTVSAGIISAKSRILKNQANGKELVTGLLLQTDASINPGNSGGALADLDGRLVGINTAIASRSGASDGVGFAIPSNRVKWITSELREHEKVRRAMMGITTDRLPQSIAEQLNLPVRGGALVTRLTQGMPGEKAGLLLGDIIVSLASVKIQSPEDLARIVEQLPAGQVQKIEVIRAAKREELEVTLVPRLE